MTTTPIRLGTTCWKMMRQVGTPMARAASMNSRDLIDSVWPRTTRAMSSHENDAPEPRHDEDRDQQVRHREGHVDDAHHHAIHAPADEAGRRAPDDADAHRH